MKITRRKLKRLIKEVKHAVDAKSILESHATISYFYGYLIQILIRARTSTTSISDRHGYEFRLLIDRNLAGIVDEVAMLNALCSEKVSNITGKSRDMIHNEFVNIRQEAQTRADLKISESFGDAYAHLLTLAYRGNDVLGTMSLVDAAHMVSPGIQIELRFDEIKKHLQDDNYLNAMESIS